MNQQAPPLYRLTTIPLSKCLHFRPKLYKDNPEGRSILRNAYRPWYFKKKFEEIEAIGMERDLAGLPVFEVPPEVLDRNASAENRAIFAECQKIVRNIRRDNQEGAIIPLAYNDQGQPKFKLSLLSSSGKRQIDIDPVIRRYNQQIMMTAIADFVLLGHGENGSWALSNDKTNLFELGLESWAEMIAAPFNVRAIPDLLRLNGMAGRCKLVPGRTDRVDLSALGLYISTIAGAGALTMDGTLEEYLRQVAKLPPKDPDTAYNSIPLPTQIIPKLEGGKADGDK
jgi:hypothetical protein